MHSCPLNYYKDDDGAGNKACLENCPISKFAHILDYECYFICPTKYYGDVNTNKCEVCSLECASCDGVNIILNKIIFL